MFKIVNNMFFERFFSNFLIILQLAISLSFCNYSIGINNAFYQGYDYTYTFKDSQYFFPLTLHPENKIDMDLLTSNGYQIEFLNYPLKISYTDKVIYSYKTKILEKFKKKLVAGNWLDVDNKKGDNVINCLIVGKTNLLNKILELNINGKNYKFYICGVLANNCKTFNVTHGSYDMTPGEVFIDYDSNMCNLVFDYNDFNTNILPTGSGFVFSNSKNDEVQHNMSIYVLLLSMEQLRFNIEDNGDTFILRIFSYFSVGVGVMGIISMICMVYMLIKENETNFYNYKNFGLRKKHIVIICSLYHFLFFILLLLLTIITSVFWPFITQSYSLNSIYNYKNILLIAIIFISIFCLNLTIFFKCLYSKGKLNE